MNKIDIINVISKYIKEVMPNVMNCYVSFLVYEELLKKHPELTVEAAVIMDNLDAEKAKKDFAEIILPLPRIDD